MVLVDTLAEQRLLEDLLERATPPLPDETAGLHYLLATPFRYPPTALGSRFRRPHDPGVFYGADAVRAASGELGYWRWRFLLASPGLGRIDPAAQTIFRVTVRGPAIDLRERPYQKGRKKWTEAGGATAVLTPVAFAEKKPRNLATWYLGVTQDRVRWTPERFRGESLGFDFVTARWGPTG